MMNLTSGVLIPAERKYRAISVPAAITNSKSPAEHGSRMPLAEDG
jgi:hypothetical protein